MTNLLVLIPIALGLGILALLAFLWAYRSGQFDDPEGDGLRILSDGEPLPPPPAPDRPPPTAPADPLTHRAADHGR